MHDMFSSNLELCNKIEIAVESITDAIGALSAAVELMPEGAIGELAKGAINDYASELHTMSCWLANVANQGRLQETGSDL
jgi:hypothetical protein